MTDDPSTPPALRTMQERLNYLFHTVRPAGEERLSYRAVSKAIKESEGLEVSAQYIHQIATGVRSNPGVRQVAAIEKFFGVPPGFLTGAGDVDKVAGELRRLQEAVLARERIDAEADVAMRDPGVKDIVIKARGVPPHYLNLVVAMLEQVRRNEGLDEAADSDGR